MENPLDRYDEIELDQQVEPTPEIETQQPTTPSPTSSTEQKTDPEMSEPGMYKYSPTRFPWKTFGFYEIDPVDSSPYRLPGGGLDLARMRGHGSEFDREIYLQLRLT